MKNKLFIILSVPLLAMIGILLYKLSKDRQKTALIPKSTAKPNPQIWDRASADKIAQLHPKIRGYAERVILEAQKRGIFLRVTSGFRSFAEQEKLYNQRPKVTNARPGQSYHNYGLSFDVVEIKNGQALWNNPRWPEIGAIGRQFGFEWGGDWTSFVDKPHFQMRFGYHHSDLLAIHNQNPSNYVSI